VAARNRQDEASPSRTQREIVEAEELRAGSKTALQRVEKRLAGEGRCENRHEEEKGGGRREEEGMWNSERDEE
jgi:hypothetical protein